MYLFMISELLVSCFGNFIIFSQKNWEIFEKMDFFNANSINFAKSFFKNLQNFHYYKIGQKREKKTSCS